MELLKRKNKNQLLFIIGLFLIACGIFAFTYYHFKYESISKNEELKIEEFFIEESTTEESILTTPVVEETEKKETKKVSYNYIAVLEIPTIGLKRGLVDPSSYYNNVDYNIQIINSSTFPDVENGNFILASHNGASYISFFKNLYKLNINDNVYIYYNGIKYEYIIEKIYDTPKDGNIEIFRNYEKTTITLITCKKNTKDKQVVYIGYLNNKSSY